MRHNQTRYIYMYINKSQSHVIEINIFTSTFNEPTKNQATQYPN